MITTPGHALTFGALNLLGTQVASGWWIEALGDDHDEGNPVPVEREIKSFLMDGTIKTTESYDNREMTLTLRITGTSSQFLADAEEALMGEVGQRNTLTWTPPDNTGDFAGTPCVFDVVNSHLDFDFDDIDELRLVRTYKLTISAQPWARAQEAVTVTVAPPPTGSPTVTSVDAATSTTNWTRSTTGTGTAAGPTVVGGAAITASMTNGTATYWQAESVTLTRSSLSASMTTTPYVRLDFTAGATGNGVDAPKSVVVTVKINGTTVTPAASNGTVYWYAMPGGASTLTSVAVTASATVPRTTGAVAVTVNDISRSDAASDIIGQRQTYSTLAVDGSVRTEGNLALYDTTPAALGSVLVYTVSNPGTLAQPNLRAKLSSGNTETTDGSTVSGKTSTFAATHTFDIPVSQLPPGGYSLLARIKHASAGTYVIGGSAFAYMGGNLVNALSLPTPSVTLTAGTWTIVDVAHMVLPLSQMGSSGVVRIGLASATAALVLDEAWLFNMDLGVLTWVECGTASPAAGGSSNRVWLDSATVDSPVPTAWQGVASDRSDSVQAIALMSAFGRHQFVPPLTNVFKVTTNSIACGLSFTAYARSHSHVA